MPIRTILVPLDGSRLARRVVPHAATLALATGARLHLLSVQEDSQLDLQFFYQAHALRISQEIQFRLARYLELVAGRLRQQGLEVATEVVPGRAAEEIARAARRVEAGIVAISTHGRSGLGRWAQGSVAQEVIRSVATPLLVLRPAARGGDAPRYQRLLVPLDGSPVAEAALPVAVDVARATGARLLLAQSVPTVADLSLGTSWDVLPGNVEEVAQATASAYLQETAARLESDGVPAHTKVLRGEPARQLLQTAASDDADLIVMATHGRSGLRRFLLGSVADRVVREAGRPVLLVRPPGADGA